MASTHVLLVASHRASATRYTILISAMAPLFRLTRCLGPQEEPDDHTPHLTAPWCAWRKRLGASLLSPVPIIYQIRCNLAQLLSPLLPSGVHNQKSSIGQEDLQHHMCAFY